MDLVELTIAESRRRNLECFWEYRLNGADRVLSDRFDVSLTTVDRIWRQDHKPLMHEFIPVRLVTPVDSKPTVRSEERALSYRRIGHFPYHGLLTDRAVFPALM